MWLSLRNRQLEVGIQKLICTSHQQPTTNYQLPITNYHSHFSTPECPESSPAGSNRPPKYLAKNSSALA
ncbi:MAG: hypothetical protein N4J56_004810 [Chroococcidiopsis sp. SAG 2025]|nr:hypothetical protein [Chroococcidiopsis sp. SAG 2025]